ncbi:MAG: SMC-Scp complex subunit ScpB [Gloeobacteraceae cyanobacterium ES-bin-144]|nr:SMC-Scp complex subunit ScpB [Verrucomicrobiales bacterium]
MQLSAIVEALLIASQNPLASEEIARLIRARAAEAEDVRIREIEEANPTPELPDWLVAIAATSAENVIAAITQLNDSYQETQRAFTILERSNGWKLYTRIEYGDFVRQLFPGRKPERMSGPAMETLAIIAYRQPITKAAIEAVRGVACDGMIQKLLDRDLIRIGGRAELPGRPLLYETTDLFFEHFGIRSIDDLPNASELRKIKLPDPEEAKPAADHEQLALGAVGIPAAAAEIEGESTSDEV